MKKLTLSTIAFMALAACEVGVGYPPGGGGGHAHSYGAPHVTYTYSECYYQRSFGEYVWEFEADVTHTYSVDEVAEVWVDVYADGYFVYSQPLDLSNIDYSGNISYWGEWTLESHARGLYCDSPVHYEIVTTAYDYYGNYDTTIDYF